MNPGAEHGAGIGRPDVVILAAFAAFAILFGADRYKGADPYVFLGTDAANIASFAAALDHPDLLAGDSVLGDADRFRFYQTIHIPLLRGLAPLVGGYGNALVALLPFHVFLQAAGFYLLGRILFVRRYWALLLALVNLPWVWVGFGTYWGLYRDVQPRLSFQVLLPFLLAAALAWGHRPRRWPWLMVAAGLMIYVHPVSAPSWAFALWLGRVTWRREKLTDGRHVAYLLALGCLFLLVCAPFLVNYFGHHAHGATSELDVDLPEVRQLMFKYYGNEFLDVGQGLGTFFTRWSVGEIAFWLLGAFGVVSLSRRWSETRDQARTVVAWGIGLGIVCALLPFIEHEICRRLGILPLEIDLIRGMRYFVPLMLIFCLWPLARVDRPGLDWPGLDWPGLDGHRIDPDGSRRRWAARIAGAVLVLVWWVWHPPIRPDSWLSCLRSGSVLCTPQVWQERIDAIEAAGRLTPPGSRFLAPPDLQLPLRYEALRPLVYSFKDRGILSYSSPREFLRWDALHEEVLAISEMPDACQRYDSLRRLAVRLEAEYHFVERTVFPDSACFASDPSELDPEQLPPIWQNAQYVLLPVEKLP